MRLRALLPVVLLGSAALAQGPGFMPPGMQTFTELKTYLSLTDAQVTAIQTAIQQSQTNVQNLLTQIRDQQTALQTALDGGSTDAAALGKILLNIQSLRQQVQTARDAVRTAALTAANLTAAQKDLLTKLDDASKLRVQIQQATALGLITPPTPPAGQGPGGPRGGGIAAQGIRGPF